MHQTNVLRKEASCPADDSDERRPERATGSARQADGGNELVARLGFGQDAQVGA
jgi:hypothetical protein